jgi:hypothetical protein
LRTAPKNTSGVPASAPYNQSQHQFGPDSSRYAPQQQQQQHHAMNNSYGQAMPQTAIGSGFSVNNQSQGQYGQNGIYHHPEQVLAPPTLGLGQDVEGMDPNVLAQLMATEVYLQQRQQQLQQQLLQLTAQQFGGMNLGNTPAGRQMQQFPVTPMTPQMGMYGNQQQQQSIIQEVAGQPGIYLVYNPMTGQSSYMVDPALGQIQLSNSPPPPTPSYTSSPPKMNAPMFRAEVSPPSEVNPNPFSGRSITPPKKSVSPPIEVTPLPPPSANAFRRGHKKVSSLAFNPEAANEASPSDGPKSALARPVGFPQTPLTGTFGPGNARAGEHPIRQPRGPPNFEELQAKPTTKFKDGKNFATRQRRRAVHSLVRAGIERRGVRSGSSGSMTPASETEITFSISSDNDSDSVHSGSGGSLSGKQSIGSLRAAASGAIGSERKASKDRSRDRSGVNRSYSTQSVSSDEGSSVGGKLVEVRAEEPRRKTPMLVLTSAEKRKSSMF